MTRMKSDIVLFLMGMAVGFAILALTSPLRAQTLPAAPPAAHKAPVHAAAKHVPTWHVMPPTPQRPQPEWGLGSWLAAPFNAIGTGVGYVGGAVGNVVETPFIAVGQAWSNENCWQHMIDRRDGQTKLFWVCK